MPSFFATFPSSNLPTRGSSADPMPSICKGFSQARGNTTFPSIMSVRSSALLPGTSCELAAS